MDALGNGVPNLNVSVVPLSGLVPMYYPHVPQQFNEIYHDINVSGLRLIRAFSVLFMYVLLDMVQATSADGVVSFPELNLRGPSNATMTVVVFAVDPTSNHVCYAPLFDVLVTDITASVAIVTSSAQSELLFCPEPR